MTDGWAAIHRRICDNWIWTDKPFSKGQAWIDMLLMVNWKEERVVIGNTVYTCARGESLRSLDTWAHRWGWSKSAVRRFFRTLESDNMIRTKNETQTTRVTICNYESYQEVRNGSETEVKRNRNASETHLTPIEQRNKENKENNINNIDAAEPPPSGGKYSSAFEFFWKAYPRKDGSKSKSYSYWKRDKLEKQVELVMSKLEAFKQSDQWKKDGGQFIPYAQKWLNEKRYESEPVIQKREYGRNLASD